MTRPHDGLLRDLDAAIAETDRGADILPAGQRAFRALAALLRECRAAIAVAREDGAREERDRIVAWIEADCPELVYGPQESIMPDIVAGIASGKHRQEKP